MPRSAAPDDARSRLRTLGADPPLSRPRDPVRGPVWGGPEAVDVGAADDEETRVGWPTAAPGTPAARLRLEAVSDGGEAGWGTAPGRDGDEAGWGSAPGRHDDDPPPRPRSAWDPPEDGHGRWARWAARWLPGSWVGARWDPGRSGALALAAVAAVAAVVAAVGVWSERPVAEPVPALPVVAPAAAPGSGPPGMQAAPEAGPIVVSVSGRVRRPGLLRLPPGSRVGEAIDAAGGAEPDTDLTGLNLAARLADGEQVLVGVPVPVTPPAAGTSAGAASAPAAGASAAPGGRLDLNSATLEQLDQLPGVGPVTAQRILEWRTQNGRFAAVEQLQEVSGIGDARFATLRELVSV